MSKAPHIPVLPSEVVAQFASLESPRIIDGTVGFGGHSARLLEIIPGSRLLCIDRDGDALRQAQQRLSRFGDRAAFFRGPFSEMAAFAFEFGWDQVDGVLLDIGVSSFQIDTPERGFSYRNDGPLDMRQDRRNRITAATLLNTEPEDELVRIFREFGEERQARRVARAVIRRREERPWSRTGEFADLLEKIIGGPHGGPPPQARCFQALRIAVNNELEELDQALVSAVELLRPGGRLAVITFHSGEDRRVKQFMRAEAATCVCPPNFPVCVCDKQATLRVLTRKPITASKSELETNSRAASAKLRVAEKILPAN